MKKAKTALIIISALLLTACSGETKSGGYPIVGTVAKEEIPSEPKLNHSPVSEISEIPNLYDFVGAAGELLTVGSAVNIYSNTDSYPDYNYILEYDHSYFTYVVPNYQRNSLENNDYYYSIDTPEALDEYNLYLKNKSVIYTVRSGDKLENGLICTDAQTAYLYHDNTEQAVPNLHYSEAAFSGELTLTGTIHCEQEESPIPDTGKGLLTFIADSDNGKVPDEYRPGIIYKASQGGKASYYEMFQLGNISDLTEEQASMIGNNEYTDVLITIKNIHLFYGNFGYTPSQIADIVDIKLI
ncbi:MAG: hypothetical protein HDT46_07535 [Ruminococcaceae bacterium]|nr:hypothetical protein [Oscillospiraceae bacterium]MBD5116816.1 hypothetical protein [Oscillospiraceae bacterium]